MNKTRVALLAATLLTAASQAFAFDLTKGHPIFQFGGFVSSQGESQHLAMQGLIGDNYSVSNHNDYNALLGLGYFLDGQSVNVVKMSYGINAFFLANTQVQGKVTQENLFTNLAYNYYMNHMPVYAAAKALIDMNNCYAFTVDAGIGPNFIHTTGFQEKSLDGGITQPDRVFAGQTNTTFSATAGIGVKFNNVIKQLPLECGYRFFYLGQGSFTKLTSQQIDTLQTGNSYANALLCSITF